MIPSFSQNALSTQQAQLDACEQPTKEKNSSYFPQKEAVLKIGQAVLGLFVGYTLYQMYKIATRPNYEVYVDLLDLECNKAFKNYCIDSPKKICFKDFGPSSLLGPREYSNHEIRCPNIYLVHSNCSEIFPVRRVDYHLDRNLDKWNYDHMKEVATVHKINNSILNKFGYALEKHQQKYNLDTNKILLWSKVYCHNTKPF